MIYIEEKLTKKLPGITSLFVNFEYKPEIVDKIKQVNNAIYDKKTTTWEVPITSLSKLIENLNSIDDVNIKFYEGKDEEIKESEIISTFNTTPFDYQLEGIKYGLSHKNWLLLDAPGLGKTLQLLYIAQELKARGEIEHCLIICGINTLKANWKKEVQKHTNLSCRILGERVNTKGKTVIGSVNDRLNELKNPIEEFIVITNIETLRNDEIVKAIEKGPNKFGLIAVDEIHTCKSPTSQQGKNMLKLKSAPYKIGMTGTLLLNDPLDAYVPLKWIGADRSTYTNFRYYYCVYGGIFNNILQGYTHLNILKDQIGKFGLRRTKDLLNLPDKVIINELVDMNDSQSKFYNDITQGIIKDVDKVHMSTASLLAMVTRLRQATATPSILTTENISSSKMDRAIDLTNQILDSNNKVVIFTTFKETASLLYDSLKSKGAVLCTGDTNDVDVSRNIDIFQTNSDCKVFIGTWQKCGTGITLTEASYMIFIDTPWTSGVYEQAQDRIHRIGTKNKVTIYNLICKDTIDERVLDIVTSKEAMSNYMIDDKISEQSIDQLRKYFENL